MPHVELRIQNIPEEQQDILSFLLAEAGFESFVQETDELLAYIPLDHYNREKTAEIFHQHPFTYREEVIPEKNWNDEWEKNFEPVLIADKCYVRAPFHAACQEYLYEIIIEPKMSFGTAHHETTSQMIELMMELDFRNKKILDMGCGTGILAILADMMKAMEVLAIDNDIWAYNNCLENIERNHAFNISVKQGGMDAVFGDFDIILANINRNILLEQIPGYVKMLNHGGGLLMSGFYQEDLPVIETCALQNNLRLEKYVTKNRWIAAKFIK